MSVECVRACVSCVQAFRVLKPLRLIKLLRLLRVSTVYRHTRTRARAHARARTLTHHYDVMIREIVKRYSRSCDGNTVFFRDLVLVEVLMLNGLYGSSLNPFVNGLLPVNVVSAFEIDAADS